MTRFKDFGEGGDTSVEPLSFKIKGETFNCVPEIQGKVLLDLAASATSEDPVKQATIITNFFEKVLEDESYTRFNDLLEDKKRIVSVETLAEITAWLMEEYTGRPEGQPGVS